MPLLVLGLCVGAIMVPLQLYKAAARSGSSARMRRAGAWLIRLLGPQMRPLIEVDVLVVEERWAEAISKMNEMTIPATPIVGLGRDNNRAWCMLQMGDIEGGLALAEKVCASTLRVRVPAEKRTYFEQTRATGLHLAGRSAEALPALEATAAAPGSTKRTGSIRWFYVAEARRALGRADATAAYERSREADPGGPWAKRAEVRLADGGAYR
jgi:hypothetical protein